MVLPPSDWSVNTRAQRVLAYVDSPPMQMSHNISGVTGPKLIKFVAAVIFFIGGIDATIRVVEWEGDILKKKFPPAASPCRRAN